MNELNVDPSVSQAQDEPMNDEYKQYRKELSIKGTAAMMRKKAEGEWMHQAPLGYVLTRSDAGKCVLAPDPNTYPFVQEMRSLRSEGYSVRAIQSFMTEKGLRSKRGNKLSVSMIHRAIQNRSSVDPHGVYWPYGCQD